MTSISEQNIKKWYIDNKLSQVNKAYLAYSVAMLLKENSQMFFSSIYGFIKKTIYYLKMTSEEVQQFIFYILNIDRVNDIELKTLMKKIKEVINLVIENLKVILPDQKISHTICKFAKGYYDCDNEKYLNFYQDTPIYTIEQRYNFNNQLQKNIDIENIYYKYFRNFNDGKNLLDIITCLFFNLEMIEPYKKLKIINFKATNNFYVVREFLTILWKINGIVMYMKYLNSSQNNILCTTEKSYKNQLDIELVEFTRPTIELDINMLTHLIIKNKQKLILMEKQKLVLKLFRLSFLNRSKINS